MERVTKKIKVSDIAEFPTQLGVRCKLFNVHGYDAYHDTEEKLMAALKEFNGDPKSLEICKNSSRCGAFWHMYQQGLTPFLNKERILASHFDGKYWIDEGKHRACMAMMAGVGEIEVDAWEDDGWRVLLDSIGERGTYEFAYTHKNCSAKTKTLGVTAVLWIHPPNSSGDKRFEAHPVMLTSEHNTGGVYKEIIDGVSYKVVVNRKITSNQLIADVNVFVKISKHPLTKVWLLKRNFDNDERILSEMKTLYRRGCFRRIHLGDLRLNIPQNKTKCFLTKTINNVKSFFVAET